MHTCIHVSHRVKQGLARKSDWDHLFNYVFVSVFKLGVLFEADGDEGDDGECNTVSLQWCDSDSIPAYQLSTHVAGFFTTGTLPPY